MYVETNSGVGQGEGNPTDPYDSQYDAEHNSLISKVLVQEHVEYIDNTPPLLKWRSSKAFIMATICLALFTDSFIYGVLVPVLPFLLKDRSNVPEDQEQIYTSVMFALFGGAILIGSPICGWYADRSSSRRLPLLISLPILAAATGLLGASTQVWVLLTSRALQGFSTAVVWTVGLALTRDTVPKHEVGQWMGTAISSNSIGLVISPMLGGLVYAHAGLWGVLGMMIGLVCLNIVLVVCMVEKRVAQEYIRATTPKNDQPQYASYGTVTYFGAESDTAVEDAATGQSAEGDGREAQQTTPHQPSVLPISKLPPMLHLLRSPRILTGAFGVFTQFGLLASFDAFLPLFVKRRFGWTSLEAGLIFLNLALPALGGPLAGKLSDRFGARRVALVGCIFTAPPLVCLRLVGYNSQDHVVLLCFLLILIGIFLTLIISPLAADISFAVDKLEADNPGLFGKEGAYAQAYALFNCAMAAACVAGPLIAGSVQDRYGTPTVAWVLAIWCGSAAIPVLFFTGDKKDAGN